MHSVLGNWTTLNREKGFRNLALLLSSLGILLSGSVLIVSVLGTIFIFFRILNPFNSSTRRNEQIDIRIQKLLLIFTAPPLVQMKTKDIMLIFSV